MYVKALYHLGLTHLEINNLQMVLGSSCMLRLRSSDKLNVVSYCLIKVASWLQLVIRLGYTK